MKKMTSTQTGVLNVKLYLLSLRGWNLKSRVVSRRLASRNRNRPVYDPERITMETVETDVELTNGYMVYVHALVDRRTGAMKLIGCGTSYDGFSHAPYYPTDQDLIEIKAKLLGDLMDVEEGI